MTVGELLATTDKNSRASLVQAFDMIQGIHDECTAKQNLVEKIDEHDAFEALKANPPADVPATLTASGAIIKNSNYKHGALLKEKALKLAAVRKALVG